METREEAYRTIRQIYKYLDDKEARIELARAALKYLETILTIHFESLSKHDRY